MAIHQSVCYPIIPLGDSTLDDLFAQLADIGYEAVELWWRGEDFESVAETAKSRGLTIASFCGHKALGDGLNNPDNHDRIEAELRESIDIAARVGTPGLICFTGNRQQGQSDYDGLAIAAKGISRIAPYAEEKGINLNVELLNSLVNHPGYLADSTDRGLTLCELSKSPAVKLLFDIYHMQIMEGNVISNLRKTAAAGRLGHIHTAGNPGRNDLDDTQELNYRGICKAISDTGYAHYVGHEFHPKGDAMAAMKHAFDVCNV